MIQNNVLLYVAKIINGSLAATGAGDVEEGVVRRGMALLLNLLTESKSFDVLEGNQDNIWSRFSKHAANNGKLYIEGESSRS